MHLLLAEDIRYENDLVLVRQHARHIAELLGFDPMEQARIAAAVSEVARNALQYAGSGRVEFAVDSAPERSPLLTVSVSDRGPGIADLSGLLSGRRPPQGSAAMGLVSARRLVDHLHIESEPGKGTRVLLSKRFPKTRTSISSRELARITRELGHKGPLDPFEEIRRQNLELIRTLEELRERQEELVRLNAELEDTNRGVVALYAELDEKAMHLRRSGELKSRFLSNMSHEFRTPLNSILALCRLLLERTDGELSDEQVKQVAFIQKNTQDLSDLVNDLLDLAKLEAGRITVKPGEMTVENLFGGLRGMFRPLLTNPLVNLVFEDTSHLPLMITDEPKVSQILRNFISNALKFTERGEVRVSAAYDAAASEIGFSVCDTGIGIAPEDQERIFEEFGQIDNPIQLKVRGTGLGLPLSRTLADLLGGRITLSSAVGAGSTFTLVLPAAYPGDAVLPGTSTSIDITRDVSIVFGGEPDAALLYEKYVRGTGFQMLPVRTLVEAERLVAEAHPVAVFADVGSPESWEFLLRVKRNDATRHIPAYGVGAAGEAKRALALGADGLLPTPLDRKKLLETLRNAVAAKPDDLVLIVDDDDVSRYLLRDLLSDTRYRVLEASSGEEGLRLASERRPRIILLDLVMPGIGGFDVIKRLAENDSTSAIPVIIVTSKALDTEERSALSRHAVAILSKGAPSRQDAVARLRDALAAAERRIS